MRVNVYIRTENIDAWNKIPNKSEWVNNKLTPLPPISKPIKQKPEPKNIFQQKKIVSEAKANFTFCPNGHPKVGDKCLGKICKYN